MDDRRFDAFARILGRRGLLALAMAGSGAAHLLGADAAAGTCASGRKTTGGRCRKGSDCCSGRCTRKRKKKKGRCACSPLRKPCFENPDCCGDITGSAGSIVCTDKVGFADIICCVSATGPCETSADCCNEFSCEAGVCG
jgi:hypothetical protein